MNQEYKFISTIRNIEITEVLGEPITLVPGIDISNDPQERAGFLDGGIAEAIGIIEADFIVNSSNVIHCEFNPADFDYASLEHSLLCHLLWLKELFKNAWVLFDHCFECDAAYMFSYVDGKMVGCTSNYLSYRTSKADGRIDSVSLSEPDLKIWADHHHHVETYLYEMGSGSTKLMLEKDICRIGRAFQFLENARSARNLGMRVALYVSAFEALFSTATAELSHQLSERVAFFLSQSGLNKREVFATLKRAYNIRSKLVHGDGLSSRDLNDLPNLSVDCDDYLRKIFLLAFGAEELRSKIDVKAQDLDEYFLSLVMGERA